VAQHPLGAEKCALGGYNSTSSSPRLLDQTSPDLFRLTRKESLSKNNSPILNIFIPSGDISRRTLKSTEIWTNFACFWLKIFLGRFPKISYRDYKIEHTSCKMSRRSADGARRLREEKKKKPQQNLRPLRKLSFPRGLIIRIIIIVVVAVAVSPCVFHTNVTVGHWLMPTRFTVSSARRRPGTRPNTAL